MKLVQGPPVIQWVAERISYVGNAERFGPAMGMGVVTEDDKLIGGVVFHGYQPYFKSIEASFASTTPRWLTRPIICRILDFPYFQLDCQRVTASTPRKSRPARRFLESFGFRQEGCVRLGFGDDDAIISGLLKTEWQTSRWMMGRSVGQEGRQGLCAGRSGDGSSADAVQQGHGGVQSDPEYGELLRA